MAKKDGELDAKIQHMVDEEVRDIKLKLMMFSCRASMIAILGFASIVGGWATSHFDRVFKAVYVLVYGDAR